MTTLEKLSVSFASTLIVSCAAVCGYAIADHYLNPAPAWPLNVPPSGAPKTPTVMDAATIDTNYPIYVFGDSSRFVNFTNVVCIGSGAQPTENNQLTIAFTDGTFLRQTIKPINLAKSASNSISSVDTTGTNGRPFLTKQDLHYAATLGWRNGFVCGYGRALGTNEMEFNLTATSNTIERMFP